MTQSTPGAHDASPMPRRVPSPGKRFPRRHHLYVWVWQQPVVQVAQILGITGPALRKRCLRYGIPMPPRGYWAQTKIGVPLPVTQLANPEHDPELDFEISVAQLQFLEKLPWPASGQLAIPMWRVAAMCDFSCCRWYQFRLGLERQLLVRLPAFLWHSPHGHCLASGTPSGPPPSNR